MSPQKLNPVEPPWYGPVCQVVWEGRRREASPYPDRVFVTPHPGERLLHSAGDHGRVGMRKRGERVETDDELADIGRDDVHALGCEPSVIAQKAQHHIEEAVRVAAMRIQDADAAAARKVLQDAVEKKRALAAAGRADDVHVLEADAVFDAQHLVAVVDAKRDAVDGASSALRGRRFLLVVGKIRVTRINLGFVLLDRFVGGSGRNRGIGILGPRAALLRPVLFESQLRAQTRAQRGELVDDFLARMVGRGIARSAHR